MKVFSMKNIISKSKNYYQNLNNYLETIVNAVPHTIFWKDKNSVFLGCNKLFAKLANLKSPDQIVGKTDYDLPWNKEESDQYIASDQEVIQSGCPKINIEESQTLEDGSTITLLTSKVPLYDSEGNINGILGIYTDITERKNLEKKLKSALKKAEAANQAKTEFLENMRHDIRTPLAGIIGCAELLQSVNSFREVNQYAKDLVDSSNSLLNFLNSILESIELATGEIPLIKKKFDIRKLLIEIINLNKALAKKKELQLNLQIDDRIPNCLIGDPFRVQRIVLELISNALTFSEKGEVNLILTLKKDKNREVILEIIVSDTGIGIPKEKQEEIFLRFKRLIPSYKGIYKGLGLGLATVKQFIDDLDGEIEVESQVGKGSIFKCLLAFKKPMILEESGTKEISLPKYKPFQPPSTKKATHTLSKGSGVEKKRILIVEDNGLAARVTKGILQILDCIVDIAPDGKTTLELLQKKNYQLILMDIGLPDTDGITLTQRLRYAQRQRGNILVPIVGLTAHISQEKKEKCLEVGMNAVILKPLREKAANELLNTFIQKESFFKAVSSSSCSRQAQIIDLAAMKRTLPNEQLREDCRLLMIEGLHEDLVKLAEYFKTEDWASIQAIAHKWQGGATYYGAKRLEQVCQELNDMWWLGEYEKFKISFPLLIQAMEDVKNACMTLNT